MNNFMDASSDGQSQKDDDGHLRSKLCALWTNEEPESQFKQTMETVVSYYQIYG